MEPLLPARAKTLVVRLPLLMLFAGVIGYFFQPFPTKRSAEIFRLVSRNIEVLENETYRNVRQHLTRSEIIFKKFSAGSLQDRELHSGEAIFETEKGVIRRYRGEIFFYRIDPLAIMEWGFIRKNQDIYLLRRMAEKVYYICHFIDLRSNFITRGLKYPFSYCHIQFFPSPLNGAGIVPEFRFDVQYGQYQYHHVLKHLRRRFILEQVFSQKDFNGYFAKKRAIRLLVMLFFLMLYGAALWMKKKSPKTQAGSWLLLLGAFFAGAKILSLVTKEDLYLPVFGGAFSHIHQILAILLFAALCTHLIRLHLKPVAFSLRVATANGLMLAALWTSGRVLEGVAFVFSDFVFLPQYLMLLFVLVLLLVFPYLALNDWDRVLSKNQRKAAILIQTAFLPLYLIFFHGALWIGLALALYLILFLFFRRRTWLIVVMLTLVSLFANSLLNHYSQKERKEFIRNNLKMILLSQNQYAMLVAREIVYEINSRRKNFFDFFAPGIQGELHEIWNSTLAAREMIPSGIFIISATGDPVASYSYQIPFIKVQKENRFPFWHEEEISADLYGKPLNLALASISVYQNSSFLGDIMVQVVNSPELILKSQDQTTIFSLNQRIRDGGISYIRMTLDNQIVENPSNITIANLTHINKRNDQWATFRHMGILYSGYLFRQNENIYMIFFPRPTLFKTVSEWIKIFIFLMLLYMIINFRSLKGFDWSAYFSSFSVKVFFMLILISMLTALVFSLFSLNFHFPALERQVFRAVYEKGRIAQNMISNLISEKGEINQNDVFMLSKVLDNHLTLYEKNELLFSSDNRRLILSQIPLYLPSQVSGYLNENPLILDLNTIQGGVQLYSSVTPDYVLVMEFSYNIADQMRAKRYYIDFIVSLSFFLILIGIASALFFRKRIVAPISTLDRGMAEVERGHLQPLLHIPREMELKNLYLRFNAMVEGIREQKKNLLELARMKTVVQLSRRLAHEIKNPLTPIKLSAEQIQKSLQDKSGGYEKMIEKSVRFIIEESEHLRKVALGFLDLSKLEKLEKTRFDLVALVHPEVENLRTLFPHIRFCLKYVTPPLWVHADRLKIKQAVNNILNNAIDACESVMKKRSEDKANPFWQREPTIEIDVQDRDSHLEITFRDNGVGMKPEEREQIFVETYSSKEFGTGLGLVIVKRIVELHKGSLEIMSRENEETTVKMRFAKDVAEA